MVSARTVAKVLLVSAAILGGLYLLYLIRTVIGAIFVAIFLAVALAPAVEFFERRRIPRALSIVLVYLSIFLVMFGIGLLVVRPIVNGVNDFVHKVPTYVEDLRKNKTIREYDDKNHITDKLKKQANKLPERLGDAVGALRSVTVGIFSAIVQLVIVLSMTFFLLLDGKRITNFLFSQLPPERERRYRAVAADVYGAVGGYVAGNFAISLIAGLTTYIVLTILGVPFAVPLAVLMAFFDLIPLVGSTIAGVVIGIVAALSDFPTALIVWVIYMVVYQQVENNVLQPFIYRRTVALHPLLVIIAVLVGASLLGILGALLAIPVAAAIQIVVKDWWHFRQHPEAAATPPLADAAPEPA
jgi:predicted PurR-regulated permease PerM